MIHPDLLHHALNLVFNWFGISGTGSHYGFWSGAGSDLGEVTLLAAVIAGYRKINCHTKGCLRIGRHELPVHDHLVVKLCAKCHPHHEGRAMTKHHIHRLHRDYTETPDRQAPHPEGR